MDLDLRHLLAALMVAESNARILHWKSAGVNFDNVHKVTGDYYDQFAIDIDVVAEMSLRVGVNPINYSSAYKLLDSIKDVEFVLVDETKDYDMQTAMHYIKEILDTILKVISEILDTDFIKDNHENVGIKSALEAMYDKYDKEARYLLTRRLTGNK